MKLEFEPPRIENDYYDYRKNVRTYGKPFADNLEKLLMVIDSVETAYELYRLPQFQMHLLKGNYDGVYSISPDNKKSKWRVLAICVDINGNAVKPNNNETEFLKSIKTLRFRKVSDHYD